MSQFTDNLRKAARQLESGEQKEIRIPFAYLDALEGGRSKHTNSYIRMTMNRALESGRIKIVSDTEYDDELGRPTPGYLMTYIAGEATPGKKRLTAENRQAAFSAAKKFAKAIKEFSPNIMGVSTENLVAVQGVVKQYQEHADKLISHMAGVEDDQD